MAKIVLHEYSWKWHNKYGPIFRSYCPRHQKVHVQIYLLFGNLWNFGKNNSSLYWYKYPPTHTHTHGSCRTGLSVVANREGGRGGVTKAKFNTKSERKHPCLWGVSFLFRCSIHFSIFKKVSPTAENRPKIERKRKEEQHSVMIIITWYVVISACVDGQVHHKMGNKTTDTYMPFGFLFSGQLK